MKQEEVAEHVAKLADGCFTSLEPLQMHFLPLAKKLAARFSKSFPSRREDIYGTSYLAMCQLLKEIYTKEEEVPRSLPDKMAATIIWAIRDYIRRDHVIRWPRRAEGGLWVYSIINETCDSATVHDFADGIPEEIIENRDQAVSPLDIEDICKQFRASKPRDKEILLLRIKRYRMDEIGTILGITGATVCTTLQRLKRNYEKGRV